MRQRKLKTRRITRRVSKCKEPIKTYDAVQDKYADTLDADPDVIEIICNVPFEDTSIGDFTTDYLIKRADGSEAVRECVFRKNLLKPRTIKLLDFSQKYWFKRGITDWKVIIDAETE